MYRLLARRWQSRLQAVLDEQRNGPSAAATVAALQELQYAQGILDDSSDDEVEEEEGEEEEEEQEEDVSMMEEDGDEDEEAGEYSDGLGYAAAAPAPAPGNEGDDEAYFSCMEHGTSGNVHPTLGMSSMDEEMNDVEEVLGTTSTQVTGTRNLEAESESKIRAVSIASEDL